MTEPKQPEEPGPIEDAQPEPTDEEPAGLDEQLEEALREKHQFRALAQRAQADLVNYRRRAAEEQETLGRTANSRLLIKLLTSMDDLSRAIAMIPDEAVAPGWLEGLQLVKRNFDHILVSEGVTPIDAEGQPFAPSEHEAVLYQETACAEAGMVINVIRDGYKLHDRVLRPAQVAVSKAPEPIEKPHDTPQQETQ